MAKNKIRSLQSMALTEISKFGVSYVPEKIFKKEIISMEYYFYPQMAYDDLVFSSSDNSILKVTGEGVLEGIEEGNVIITIYSPKLDQTLNFNVEVLATNKARYIRLYCSVNNHNNQGRWLEVEVYEKGVNIALGLIPTCSFVGLPPNDNLGIITNNQLRGENGSGYFSTFGEDTYLEFDLGSIKVLDSLKIWHCYAISNEAEFTFKNVKIETSIDLEKWNKVYSSSESGTYLETLEGKEFLIK